MLMNERTSVYINNELNLTDEQINKINKIDTIEENVSTLTTEVAQQKNNYDTKISEIQNTQIENLNNAINTLESILKYDETIGDEELTTTAKTIKGAINEINSK